jgi:hypothetical protein
MNVHYDFGWEQVPKEASAQASFRIPGLTRDIQVKIASEPKELEQAFELLAATEMARTCQAPGGESFRFTDYHALPGAVTLIAKADGRVVATLSLVPDTAALGLPMETSFGGEVERLRQEGRKLAEAVNLADSGLSVREFVQVFKSLINLAMQYHLSRGGDSWIITVNPRHRCFYQKVLGFEPVGSLNSSPAIQNHSTEAYLFDINRMRTTIL